MSQPQIPGEQKEVEEAETKKSGFFYAIMTLGIIIVLIIIISAILYYKKEVQYPAKEEKEPVVEPKKKDYPEVESYVLKGLNKGLTFEQISSALKKAEWSDEIIESVIKNIKDRNRKRDT